jgi:hypothetical protein
LINECVAFCKVNNWKLRGTFTPYTLQFCKSKKIAYNWLMSKYQSWKSMKQPGLHWIISLRKKEAIVVSDVDDASHQFATVSNVGTNIGNAAANAAKIVNNANNNVKDETNAVAAAAAVGVSVPVAPTTAVAAVVEASVGGKRPLNTVASSADLQQQQQKRAKRQKLAATLIQAAASLQAAMQMLAKTVDD